MDKKPFKGVIKLDIRDSVADWEPYTPKKAPVGAPNVLFVLYDGGRINMPTLQKLADNGLMYSQWHTTALCSPTRSTCLTGRNHHLTGNACITEGANGFPGAHCRIPDTCATVGQILQDAGWSTFWLGKNHNVPETDAAEGASRTRRASTASTGSSAARPTSGIPPWSKTTTPSNSPTHRKKATTFPRTWRIRPSR
jgi:arylsulfatase A-like enzyme